jgi:hypothetical protein
MVSSFWGKGGSGSLHAPNAQVKQKPLDAGHDIELHNVCGTKTIMQVGDFLKNLHISLDSN